MSICDNSASPEEEQPPNLDVGKTLHKVARKNTKYREREGGGMEYKLSIVGNTYLFNILVSFLSGLGWQHTKSAKKETGKQMF